jgi:hypothetical protein
MEERPLAKTTPERAAWQTRRLEQVRELRAQGRTLLEIAAEAGVSNRVLLALIRDHAIPLGARQAGTQPLSAAKVRR